MKTLKMNSREINRKSRFFLPLIALLLFSCGGDEEKEEKSAAVNPRESIQPEKVVGIGRITPLGEIVDIVPEKAGIVDTLYVKASDSLEAGALIARLNNRVEEAEVRQAKASVVAQRSQLAAAKESLEKALSDVAFTERNYQRYQQAYELEAATKQRLDEAENSFVKARQEVARQRALLENAGARLQELQARVAVVESRLEKGIVRAPTRGLMLTVEAKEGGLVSQQQLIGQFAPEGPLIALTEVDELFVGSVELGQAAYVRLQGSTDTLATGRVTEVSPLLRQKSLFQDEVGTLEDRRVREVKVLLEGYEQEEVFLGMRVETVILTNGNKNRKETAPKQAAE